MDAFGWPKTSAGLTNWTRQLHSNAEANRPLLAGEIGRDSTPHTATISPLLAAASASAFGPATRGEDTTARLSKEAGKRQAVPQDRQGKRPAMKKPNSRDKSAVID